MPKPAAPANQPSSTLQINFSDEMTAEQQRAAKESVAALVARSSEARALQQAEQAYETELATAINKPLVKIIESDPAAAKALAADRERRQQKQVHLRKDTPPALPETRPQGFPASMADLLLARAGQSFGAPFHFDWRWHNGQPPHRSEAHRPSGHVFVEVSPNGEGFVDAHAGFGVVLTTDRVKPVLARSQRSSSHNYVVNSGYLGGSATAEGGMEITVLEDGRFLTAAQDKRWRKRVSAGESDSGDSGGFVTGADL